MSAIKSMSRTFFIIVISIALFGALGVTRAQAQPARAHRADVTPPTVDAFTAASFSASLAIAITDFSASDDVAVTGYMITGSATAPLATDSGWVGTAPTTYTVGGDGSYTLYPWAKDAEDNISAEYGSPVSVTVDTAEPETSIDSQPSDPDTDTTPAFTFSGADGPGSGIASFECRLDGGGYSACTSGADLGPLGDGAHTFYVRAIDNAGNTDTSPASYSWTVDATAPTVISSVRDNLSPTGAASVDFTVTFSESVTGVDAADFSLATTGVSGASITGLSGLGATRTVTVNTGTGGGSIRLDVVDNDSIVDAASNPLGGAGAGSGDFTGGEAYALNPGRIWYVAATGNNSNSCAATDSPCLTINGALGKAAAGDTIEVAVGTYTGTGTEVVLINKSISLSGGWNAGFTTQSGVSIVDGQVARGGIIVSSGNIIVDHFTIKNGTNWNGGIYNAGNLTINNSTISGNIAVSGGGLYNAVGGIATLNHSTISGNLAGSTGGGLDNRGTLTLNDSTVWNNSADEGGGLYNRGTLTLNNTTVSGNTATYVFGGGGLSNSTGTLTLTNSTVSGNFASAYAAGISNYSGTFTIKNTIIAGNTMTNPYSGITDCYGTITSSGYNLVGNTSGCSLTSAVGDLLNVDPQLGSFIGQFGYHPLLAGSPAIDAGNPATPGSGGNACAVTDQRGVARVGQCDIGAYEYTVPGSAASIWTVGGTPQRTPPLTAFANPLKAAVFDSSGSPVNGVTVTFTAPASGASGTFADSGTNSTTATTNANGIATSATFTANNALGTYAVSAVTGSVTPVDFVLKNFIGFVANTGNDANDCASPSTPCASINGALAKSAAGETIKVAIGTYTGAGAEVVRIDKAITLSGGWDAGFSAQSGLSIIDGETARRGIYTSGDPVVVDRFQVQHSSGGIINDGTLTINNATISDNSTTGMGGGIFNASASNLTINNTTISNNYAAFEGGGILNSGGNVVVNNSTISGNTTPDNYLGGGISSFGTFTLNNSTVTGNAGFDSIYDSSGSPLMINNSTISGNKGGIHSNTQGDVVMRNSILAGNTFSGYVHDCLGPITSAGYNLIGNNTDCTVTGSTGDKIGNATYPIDPLLGPLQNNGGPTLTRALLSGSPAFNMGNPALPGSGANACLATDQRGQARPAEGACDIGAYEVGTPFVIPSPLSPSVSTADTTPTYKWTKIFGATKYEFQLFMGAKMIYSKTVMAGACGASTCSHTLSNVLRLGSYQWKVRAMVGGVWMSFSAPKPFKRTVATVGFWSSPGLDFYVLPVGNKIKNFSITVRVYGCGIYKITNTASLAINPVSKRFAFAGFFQANGTFNTPTTVSGTLKLYRYYLNNCGYVSGGPFTWTAKWRNNNQPTALLDDMLNPFTIVPEQETPFTVTVSPDKP